MASDLLAKIGSELDARLGELRPLVLEYERLKAAEESLGTAQSAAQAPAGARASVKRTKAKKPPAKKTTTKPSATKKAPTKPARRTKRQPGEPVVKPVVAKRSKRARQRASVGRFEQAVLDALEHGSHTVAELVMVTAMDAKEIRGGIRKLLSDTGIVKVRRDGKTAYALPPSTSPDQGAAAAG